MAKERKPSKEELLTLERRNNQVGQLDEVIAALTKRLDDLRQKQKKLDLLQSVSLGLYDELDKLAKKAGADLVTDLALEQVNDFIRDSKTLLIEDPYVQRQKEFVAAGDNPQHRDVVVVMRQIRQGLERFAENVGSMRERAGGLLADARGIRCAVKFFIQGHEDVSEGDLKANEVAVRERWMKSYHFSFDLLDRTDIPNYFKAD